MPPEFSMITSFHLDLDDWYSCHTSDDEAFQDALERNSVASFYTARGAASTSTSIAFTSIALGSPSRLADADQALAEMVPEPLGDARPQHDPPELDEEDAPVSKRTRSICAGPLPSAYSPTRASTPSTKAKTSAKQLWPRRGQPPLRAVTTSAPSAPTAKPSQPATPSAGPLRASISVLPDGSSVRLQLAPAIFCFGDVPLPVPGGTTDYSAVLMGLEGDLVSSPVDGKLAEPYSPQPPTFDMEEPTTPKAEPMSKLDVDCAVKLLTRPCGTTPYKPGSAAKDQTKAKRQAGEGKERKPGGGFPGSFIQRLLSGLRHSVGGGGGDRNQGVPPPATVHELGSELLAASAATTAAELGSAAQLIPVVAGYVQAAPAGAAAGNVAAAPAATNAVNATAETATMDEAAAAAQRLSAEIFRNVLRTSAGGAATPKTLLSPRDTAFPPPESRTSRRDQMATPVPPEANNNRQATPTREMETPVTESQLQSPGDGPPASPGGEAALALLVGLAAEAVGGGAEPPEALTPARSSDPLVPKEEAVAADREGLLTPNLSMEALDCSGLPMPELEQCDSPVTVGAPLALAPASIDADAAIGASSTESPDLAESAETPTVPLLPAVIASPAERAVAAAEVEANSPATASPRTVSKRAYGTVARLVKKMAPSFRDSTVMSMSANSAQTSMCAVASAMPLAFTAAATGEELPSDEEGVVLVVDEAAACLVTVPSAGNADAGTAKRSPAKSESTEAGSGDGAAPAMGGEPETVQAAAGAGAAAPALFVFGQEQPKAAKSGKTRSASKATGLAAACEDGAAPSETAGRKRKGGDEILPNAKVPVMAERTSSSASQDGLAAVSPAEQPSTVAPPPPPSDTDSASAEPQATHASTPSPQADAAVTEVASGKQGAIVAAADTSAVAPEEVVPSAAAITEAAAPAAAAAAERPVRAEEPESMPVAAQPAAAAVEEAVTEADVEPIIETAAEVAAEAPATKTLVALNNAPAPDPMQKLAAGGEPPAAAAAPVDVNHSPAVAQMQEPVIGSCAGSSAPGNPSTVVTTTTAPAAVDSTRSSAAALESGAAAMTAQQAAAAASVVQLPEPTRAVPGALEVTEKKAPAAISGASSASSSTSSMQVAVAAHVQEAAGSPSCNKPQEAVAPAAKLEEATAAKAIETIVSEARAPTGEAAGAVAAEVATAAAPVVTARAAEPQPPAELPPAGGTPEKPSEGGKHKRRGSFAFFSCFRA